jgi:hypothetical protein
VHLDEFAGLSDRQWRWHLNWAGAAIHRSDAAGFDLSGYGCGYLRCDECIGGTVVRESDGLVTGSQERDGRHFGFSKVDRSIAGATEQSWAACCIREVRPHHLLNNNFAPMRPRCREIPAKFL